MKYLIDQNKVLRLSLTEEQLKTVLSRHPEVMKEIITAKTWNPPIEETIPAREYHRCKKQFSAFCILQMMLKTGAFFPKLSGTQ